MKPANKLSVKTRLKAGSKYLQTRFRYGLKSRINAESNAVLDKLKGTFFYEPKDTVARAAFRRKKRIRADKKRINLEIIEIKKWLLKFHSVMEQARRWNIKFDEPELEDIILAEKEKTKRLEFLERIKPIATAQEIALSGKEARKRFFRLKKFKKRKKSV